MWASREERPHDLVAVCTVALQSWAVAVEMPNVATSSFPENAHTILHVHVAIDKRNQLKCMEPQNLIKTAHVIASLVVCCEKPNIHNDVTVANTG